MVELKKTLIHQHHISGQHLGVGRSLYKITEEGKMVDTYGKEKEKTRKYKVVLLKGGGEDTNLENMEALYASIRSWGTEEEDDTHFSIIKWSG